MGGAPPPPLGFAPQGSKIRHFSGPSGPPGFWAPRIKPLGGWGALRPLPHGGRARVPEDPGQLSRTRRKRQRRGIRQRSSPGTRPGTLSPDRPRALSEMAGRGEGEGEERQRGAPPDRRPHGTAVLDPPATGQRILSRGDPEVTPGGPGRDRARTWTGASAATGSPTDREFRGTLERPVTKRVVDRAQTGQPPQIPSGCVGHDPPGPGHLAGGRAVRAQGPRPSGGSGGGPKSTPPDRVRPSTSLGVNLLIFCPQVGLKSVPTGRIIKYPKKCTFSGSRGGRPGGRIWGVWEGPPRDLGGWSRGVDFGPPGGRKRAPEGPED